MIATTPNNSKAQALLAAWKLAWPLIVANASLPLMAAVDTAVAGRLDGPQPLAAIALGGAWVTLVFWAFGFLRIAMGGLAAQAFGRGDRHDSWNLLAQGLVIAVAIGAALSVAGWWLIDPMLARLALEPGLGQQTLAYTGVRWGGAILALAYYALHGWLMGQGNTRALAVVLVATNLINMALSAGLGLWAGQGVAGIALATVLSQLAGVAMAVWLVHRQLGSLWMGWPNWAGARQLFSANALVFVRALALLAVFTWFNTQSALLSAMDAAVNAILLTLLAVAAYSLDGFADAAEIQTGHAIGRRDPSALRLALWAGAVCSLTSAALASLLLWLGAPWWVGLLSNQAAISDQALAVFWWLAPLPLVAWISYFFDGVFIGANRFKPMAWIMLASTGLVYFPLWYATQGAGLAGLWIAFWGWQLARAGAMACFFKWRLWPSLG
ncbi:MATE family efflux transporter [Litorivicinus lipolyticus]|uniref:MATE family efflux transporter n=1 Tax=Litorivicinus lipolyticus TaxID=418701 RepID=UPI003B5B8A21